MLESGTLALAGQAISPPSICFRYDLFVCLYDTRDLLPL